MAERSPNEVFEISTRHVKKHYDVTVCPTYAQCLCAGCPRGAVRTHGGCPSSGAGDVPGPPLVSPEPILLAMYPHGIGSWPKGTFRGQVGLCPSCSVPGQPAPRDTWRWRMLLSFPAFYHSSWEKVLP